MRENIYLDCLIGEKGERFWCDSHMYLVGKFKYTFKYFKQ